MLLSLGTDTWKTNVGQGIMQGSSYSADLFARIIDFHLRGLQDRWSEQFPRWRDAVALPHFLLYADDIMLFAMDARELQLKLRDLTDSLANLSDVEVVAVCNGAALISIILDILQTATKT